MNHQVKSISFCLCFVIYDRPNLWVLVDFMELLLPDPIKTLIITLRSNIMNKKMLALVVSSVLGVSNTWADIQTETLKDFTKEVDYCKSFDIDYDFAGLDAGAVAAAFAKSKVWVKGSAKLQFDHAGNAGAIKSINLTSTMNSGQWAVADTAALAFAVADTKKSLAAGVGIAGAEAKAQSILDTFNKVIVNGPNIQDFYSGLYIGSLNITEVDAFAVEFAAAFTDGYCTKKVCSKSEEDKAWAFALAAGEAIAKSRIHFATKAKVERTPGKDPYSAEVNTYAKVWSYCDADAWAKAKAKAKLY
jgi:hypothetical protein